MFSVGKQERQDVKSSDERWFFESSSPLARASGGGLRLQHPADPHGAACRRRPRRKLAVFPEFCLTGYTCGDLFLQRTLQQGALTGLQELLDASRELDTVALVGLP